MGIRFLCPTCGHRLNVKSFLAGKRGVCPQCGSGLDIPLESQISKGQREKDHEEGPPLPMPAWSDSPAAGDAPAWENPFEPASVADDRLTVPMSATAPAVPGPAGPAPAIPVQPAPLVQPTVPMHAPVAPVIPVAPMTPAALPLPDPIDEAPEAIWYVRPPAGGQYGPARGEVMRKWIGEGRVSRESLIWREGWSDWCTAGQVFPSLGSVALPPTPAPLAAATYAPTPRSSSARPMYQPRSRSSLTLTIVTVLLLGLMSVALLITLVLVIKF